MKLNQISYFIAVAEEENVSRAATRLNISQPPLTRQIQNLESSLGVMLFNRHWGGMALTEAGTVFLREARNIQAMIDLAVDRVRRAGRGEFGRFDISVYGSGILGIIPKIIHEFRLAHPEVDVSIHWQSKEDQILSLRHRTINVAFNRFVEPQSDLIVECISKEKIYLAVNSLSDLARLDSVDLRDCSEENFIMFPTKGRPGFYDKAVELCREAGFVPHIAQEVGDITTGIALVASGFGAAFVTESATAIGVPNVVYMKLDELPGTPTVDLSCIYLNGLISPILQRFLDIARSLADRSSEP